MADLAGGAVGGVESFAALDERREFFAQNGQFAYAFLHLTKLGRQQVSDVAARCVAVCADVEHATQSRPASSWPFVIVG